MSRIFVKPVEGKRCKDPSTFELLPKAGKSVLKTSYWLRRIKDGDCIDASKEVAQAKPVSLKPKKSDKPVKGDK